jgi:hypothetical protein
MKRPHLVASIEYDNEFGSELLLVMTFPVDEKTVANLERIASAYSAAKEVLASENYHPTADFELAAITVSAPSARFWNWNTEELLPQGIDWMMFNNQWRILELDPEELEATGGAEQSANEVLLFMPKLRLGYDGDMEFYGYEQDSDLRIYSAEINLAALVDAIKQFATKETA